MVNLDVSVEAFNGKNHIVIDFDGVIANTPELKSQWIKEKLNLDVPSGYTDSKYCIPLIGETNYELMLEEVGNSQNLLEIEGAREGIIKLKKLGFNLRIVTGRRPERLELARNWLVENDMVQHFDDLLGTNRNSKAPLIRIHNTYAVIDDEMKYLMDLDKEILKILLTGQGQCQNCVCYLRYKNQNNIVCANNWETAVKLIEFPELKCRS